MKSFYQKNLPKQYRFLEKIKLSVEFLTKTIRIRAMAKLIKQHKTLFLIIGDLVVLYCALLLTLLVRGPSDIGSILLIHLRYFSIIFLPWLLVLYITGLDDKKLINNKSVFFKKLVQATLINGAIAVAFFYLLQSPISPKRNLFFVMVFFWILFYLWRQIFYLAIKSNFLMTKIAFVGINKEVLEIIDLLEKNPQFGYRIDFVLTSKENPIISLVPKHINLRQGLSSLNNLLETSSVNKIIVAMNPESNPVLAKELYHSSSNIEFIYFPDFYEQITQKIPIEMINRFWLQSKTTEKSYEFFKRIFDITLATLGGVILAVLFPFISLAYIFSDGFPITFTQSRVGRHGKKFRIYKLRTMIKDAERERPLWAEENDVRVTRLGRFLRKYYIDEFPQFLNILKGEMSVVGPRPERPEFVKTLEKEITFYPLRNMARPGVTGWAQVNSFYARSVDDSVEKTRYDLYYVKNHSLIFDIEIILRTVKMIFSKREKQNY